MSQGGAGTGARPILPGATIGILGGGQLGRMTGMAARAAGYEVHVLDPDPQCPAAPIAGRVVTGPFDDPDAAADLARGCDVVTLEIEQIGVAALEAAGRLAPVRPGPAVIAIVQDRARQKTWLAEHGFPVGAFRVAGSGEALVEAAAALGACIAKAARGGYDGRGQIRLRPGEDAGGAWAALGARPCVVEQFLDVELELSVLVARRPGGETVVYPPALNHHAEGVLAWSVLPAPVPEPRAREAATLARAIAEALDVRGLLAVELFVTRDGRLLVNELAPRPHNTYHGSERACLTSQFEQLVRAVCDLPLGAPDVVRPGAIHNLLGDVWLGARPPDFEGALAPAGSRLHLYGKREARAGRKMGHLSTLAATPDEALARVLDAYAALTRDAPR